MKARNKFCNMGSFFAKLFGFKKETSILMLGLDGAGKTTILYKLKLGEVVTCIPTIGFNVEEVQYKRMKMKIWDIGGQDKIRPLWRHYYSNSNALIFVVDGIDRERIDEAREELHGIMNCPEMRDDILLVFSNKQDLPTAMTHSEVADKLDLRSIKQPWYLQNCVAVNSEGLYEGLEWLSKNLE